MSEFDELNKAPHRRFNPLTDEWVLVSPHRTQRPWQGRQEETAGPGRPEYDENCYLCPGNTRAGGQRNPRYAETFVFVNDFPALLPDTAEGSLADDPLFRAEAERGICKVICFSPRHDLSVSHMTLQAVTRVVEVWKDEYEALSANPDIAYVQIFENKGAIMGCSNPHPHCQVWSSSSVPPVVAREQETQAAYLEKHGRPLLLDYLEREMESGVRLVYENETFAVVVPFWAVWPFETMILPKARVQSLAHFDTAQLVGLADAYRRLSQAYDQVFHCEFPYTAGIHQAPSTGDDHDAWQLHMHFYPPLLRSATVKKFMVGYELLAAAQRDITAERAAETLRRALTRADA
jgi:UDPglucose--hexose-1-phosphate uridylyltransferase